MFKRETIKFLIPTSLLSLDSMGVSDREVVPLYINPRSFTIDYAKIIQDTQTIGGFIVQYWGDRITSINIQGSTGSGGIDAINILHSIYRAEQQQFKNILLKRQFDLAKTVAQEQADSTKTTTLDSLSALDQVLLDGTITNFVNGIGETMDFFKSAVAGNDVSKPKTTNLLPTLSAFAVSLDMHFQGKVFRGYIESMNVSETADSPGLFEYTMRFKSLKEYGERTNFMPWHTNPRDEAGNPKQSPTIGSNSSGHNLSFPMINAKETVSTAKSISRVIDDQSGTSQETSAIISRFQTIK